MRACPFCAEEIQDAAIVCKHCGRDVPATLPAWETEARALSREAGKTVHAAQRIRIANPSMSLKDVKALIDRWQREDGTVLPTPPPLFGGGLTGKLTVTPQVMLLGGLLIVALVVLGYSRQEFSRPTTAPATAKPPVANMPAAKPPAAAAPAPRPPATARRNVISGDQWYGCATRDQFEKLSRYVAQKDREAFSRELAGGIVSGTCVDLKDGESVFVVESAMLSGMLKIRRAGQTEEYWTNFEAVK